LRNITFYVNYAITVTMRSLQISITYVIFVYKNTIRQNYCTRCTYV